MNLISFDSMKYSSERYPERVILFYILDTSNFLVVCNSATNFLVYWNSNFNMREHYQQNHQMNSNWRMGTSPSPLLLRSYPTGGVTASRTLLDDSYTHQEVHLLSKTATDLWSKPNEESGLKLGQCLLIRFLEIKPIWCRNFGIPDNCEREDWLKSTRLLECGDKFGELFDSLIRENRRNSLTTESRILGTHHCELGKSAN